MGRFDKLKGKKILVYGTGRVAESVLDELKGFEVVGIIDRIRMEGTLKGISILTWDDLYVGMAEILIIASLKRYYKEIYHRIQYYCSVFHLTVYGENGINLSREYQFKEIDPKQERYFHKNEEELKRLMKEHDAVSFDLFDTLVMRKTLEDEDVFELVEDRIRQKGIEISGFKKKRRTAELRSSKNCIDEIYKHLREITGISEEECALVLQEEIECERECLILRRKMVELMDFAVQNGKRVSIIARTCFPASVTEDFLSSLSITGYEKIYSSFGYSVEEEQEIFKRYRNDSGRMTCLHIGTKKAQATSILQTCDIDFYEIKSAYEMWTISSLKKLLVCSDRIDNRVVLGFMAGEIFNNPFALYRTSGVVSIKTLEEFAILFMVPIVLIYLQSMIKTIEEKNIEKILFTARDGYLFKKVYDISFLKSIRIPSVYFLASRKLCLRSTIDSEEGMLSFCKGFSTDGELKFFLKEFLQEQSLVEPENEPESIKEFLLFYNESLSRLSGTVKKNYLRYIEKMDLHSSQKYLFCELCSTGTVHEALNQLWNTDLDGFYLYKRTGIKKRVLNIVSVYDDSNGYHIEQFRDLLEIILTSGEPSICGMDEKGEPIYSAENRTTQELLALEKIHEAIIKFVQEYVDLRGTDKTVTKEFPDLTLGLLDYVVFESEMNGFMSRKNVDDMTQRQISIVHE
jgi:hypothetical protein